MQAEVVCSDEAQAAWLTGWPVPVHAIGPGSYGSYGYNSDLAQWLAKNLARFDVGIIEGIWMYHSLATRRAALKAGVPYALYVHGALDPWFRRKYPLKHLKKSVYWKLIEGKVFRDAAGVIFTTEAELALANQSFQPYRCTPRVVPYGLVRPPAAAANDSIPLIRKSIPSLRGAPYILFFGRIHEKKGIDTLISAFASCHRLIRYDLVIAGTGDRTLVSRLQQLAANSEARDRLHWTGALYSSSKWAVLRGADAFVLPSHGENFGVAVAESLACGTPVLISNRINIWPEVAKYNAGLIEDDSMRGTRKLLTRWAELTQPERTAMRASAQKCFEESFLIDDAAEKLHSALKEMARGGSSSTGELKLAASVR